MHVLSLSPSLPLNFSNSLSPMLARARALALALPRSFGGQVFSSGLPLLCRTQTVRGAKMFRVFDLLLVPQFLCLITLLGSHLQVRGWVKLLHLAPALARCLQVDGACACMCASRALFLSDSSLSLSSSLLLPGCFLCAQAPYFLSRVLSRCSVCHLHAPSISVQLFAESVLQSLSLKQPACMRLASVADTLEMCIRPPPHFSLRLLHHRRRAQGRWR